MILPNPSQASDQRHIEITVDRALAAVKSLLSKSENPEIGITVTNIVIMACLIALVGYVHFKRLRSKRSVETQTYKTDWPWLYDLGASCAVEREHRYSSL